jgi:two-component system, OmpR family, response regulator
MRQLLLVEDEVAVVDSLTMALECDFEVHTANNGRVALDRLSSETFDVVVLDLMMPVLSGEDLLRELQGRPHPPIVVASAARELPELCARLGVKHYLQKPYRVPALLEKIDESLRETAQSSQRSST